MDIDVSPFDNSGTKKEGVAWTYKKLHGYAPNFAYLGEEAQALGEWEEPRPGKEIYTGETWRTRDGKRYRVVFEVIYRTIAADGQRLLLPEIEISTWWTSLRLSPKKVIELYHQHGTSEQFHSELKSDMDLERLPSGKFATNALMLSLSPGGLQPASSVRPNGVGRE